jgi:hypothetical protein
MVQAESVEQDRPSERKSADPRVCQTHAFVSAVFAYDAANKAVANAWAFNAIAWAEITALRARIGREKRKSRWYDRPPE